MTITELQKALEPLMKYELFTVRQLAFLLNLEQLGGATEAGLIRKRLGIGRPCARFSWPEASHHPHAQRGRPALLRCENNT